MKKGIFWILTIIFIVICVIVVYFRNIQKNEQILLQNNQKYEKYLEKTIYGTDLTSLINKMIDINEQNKLEKDKDGFYIENDENSIILEIKMKTIEKTYRMETFYNNDITEFVATFNSAKFRCKNIEYNSKGKVSKMIFEELLEEFEE